MVGVAVTGSLFLALDAHRRILRRQVLGLATQALGDALADLEQDGELGDQHMHTVERIRHLAESVAKAVKLDK